MYDDFNEYGRYEDDLLNWEDEQVFQDACSKHDEFPDCDRFDD